MDSAWPHLPLATVSERLHHSARRAQRALSPVSWPHPHRHDLHRRQWDVQYSIIVPTMPPAPNAYLRALAASCSRSLHRELSSSSCQCLFLPPSISHSFSLHTTAPPHHTTMVSTLKTTTAGPATPTLPPNPTPGRPRIGIGPDTDTDVLVLPLQWTVSSVQPTRNPADRPSARAARSPATRAPCT